MQCLWEPEEGTRSLVTGVKGGGKPAYIGTKLGSFEARTVFALNH